MLEKFTVFPNKRDGYNRLVGQQNPINGLGQLNSNPIYDADNSNTGINQVALSGLTALASTNNLSSVTYNTPSGISPFTMGQSNSTIDPYVPIASTANQSINEPARFGAPYTGAQVNPPFYQPSSYALAQPTDALSDASFDNFSNASGTFPLDQIQSDFAMSVKSYVNGFQTPKPVQPPLEIWNKLKFWFNDDVRLSIPSVSIPFGQRFITIELAQGSDLVYEYPSIYLESICSLDSSITFGAGVLTLPATNVTAGTPNYVTPASINTDTYTVAVTSFGSATTAPSLTPISYTYRSYSPIVQYNGVNAPAILMMEMYINNIFVNPEVHDIFIKRIGFALIRVYRQQQTTMVGNGLNSILLSSLKWPVEYMFVGLQPLFNTKPATASAGFVTGGNVNIWRDWYRMTRQVLVNANEPCLASNAVCGSTVNPVVADTYFVPVSTIDSLSLVSHGINIYESFQDTFFTAYAPYHYSTHDLVTPTDTGAFFINIALFPRSYQPSGHLNISRARETYLKFNSSYCSAKTPCMLLIVALCINFILISDGSAILRYST